MILAALLFLVDQTAKSLAVHLNFAQFNSGIAFGIQIAPALLLPIIFILLVDLTRRKVNFADLTILAGGLSNLLDRLHFPGVVDWIHLGSLWFNLADVYITFGVLWIFLSYLRIKHSSLSISQPA